MRLLDNESNAIIVFLRKQFVHVSASSNLLNLIPTSALVYYNAVRPSCAPKDEPPFSKVMQLLVFSV